MCAQLPDEILSNIARACLEPYRLTLICCYDKPRRSLKISEDVNFGLLNAKLTNELFYDEIRSAVRDHFDGTVLVKDEGTLHTSQESQLLNDCFNPDTGRLSWAAKHVHRVGILAKTSTDLGYFDPRHFPNLKTVYIGINRMVSLPGYSRGWKTPDIESGKHNLTIEMCFRQNAREVMNYQDEDMLFLLRRGIKIFLTFEALAWTPDMKVVLATFDLSDLRDVALQPNPRVLEGRLKKISDVDSQSSQTKSILDTRAANILW